MNSKATLRSLEALSTEFEPSSQGRMARADAERVGAGAAEGVPVDDREPQVVLHRLALDDLVGVVVLEGERVLRLRTFELDPLDLWEK